jgi:hypothetical protein
MLKNLGHDAPFDFKKDWIPFRTTVELTFSSGVDGLRENSLHYDKLAPALMWLTRVALDGVNLRNLESMPRTTKRLGWLWSGSRESMRE